MARAHRSSLNALVAMTAVAMLTCSASLVNAAPITETFTVAGTGFYDFSAPGSAPYANVAGTFTLTFDPSSTGAEFGTVTFGGLTPSLFGSNGVLFKYQQENDAALEIGGGYGGGADGLVPSTNDFLITLFYADTTAPTIDSFFYATPTSGDIFVATSSTLSVSAVPEPASVGLIGMAALGLLGRRGRRTVA